MDLELLSPDYLLDFMQTRAEELQRVCEKMKATLAQMPAGRLRLVVRKNNLYGYHVTEENNSKGVYISRKKFSLAEQLAQKEFYEKTLREVECELNLIDNFIQAYKPQKLLSLYNDMPSPRKSLIKPIQLSDDEFSRQWQSIPFKGKAFAENEPELYTAKGERVRSKSEVIIADTLERFQIPYKYEHPFLHMHPDFTCLDLRTRQEILWEHFGLMDNPEYVEKTIAKLSLYIKAGFTPGENLIITMESTTRPLNSADVSKIIGRKFLVKHKLHQQHVRNRSAGNGN